jgi:hypothetical protein
VGCRETRPRKPIEPLGWHAVVVYQFAACIDRMEIDQDAAEVEHDRFCDASFSRHRRR